MQHAFLNSLTNIKLLSNFRVLQLLFLLLSVFIILSPRQIFFSQQNSTLTIEEFHSKLQEATNFPLRPFVIPFLKVLHSSVIWKVFQTILLLGHRCVLQFLFLRESEKLIICKGYFP